VVINFWGTWCGPCKSELGEVQKFYEKYKDNPNVVFLTIDSKDTTEEVKKFMANKKYTFPVLMEGDYLSKATVNIFPTTWFIDREGNKIFEKNGSSKRLLEEFSWRLEGMMEMATAQKTGAAKTP
jgi:thiol-disulfide isomerase/thioredoxin